MDGTLLLLGGALVAYYLIKNNKGIKDSVMQKIEELRKQIEQNTAAIEQNTADDVARENDLVNALKAEIDPIADGAIAVWPYVQFTHMGKNSAYTKYWYGNFSFEIHNYSNHAFTIGGVMASIRLCGFTSVFMPANSSDFPRKIFGKSFYTAESTWQDKIWFDTSAKRDAIRAALPNYDEPYPILECDIVVEVINTATGDSDFVVLRNVKGVAVWRSQNFSWKPAGQNAAEGGDWKEYISWINGKKGNE